MAHLTRGAFALALLSTLSAPAAAQQPVVSEPDRAVVDNATADRLLEQAVALESNRSSWPKAARLYAKSAELRAYGDVRAHQAYQRAGHLLFGSDRPEPARQMYVKAGVTALEAGRVYEAAQNYLSAAELIAWYGARPLSEDPGIGVAHMQMALRLSDSPLLTDQQRTILKARVRT